MWNWFGERETWGDRDRKKERKRSISGLTLSAQCSMTRLRLLQRALKRYITRSFSWSLCICSYCWLKHYQMAPDVKKNWECAHTKKKICDTTGPFGQLTYQWIKHLKSISLGAFIQNPKEGVQGVLEKLLEKYKTGFHFLNLNFKYILIEIKQWHFLLNSELYCTI